MRAGKLMEEFLVNSRDYQLEDLKGHYVEFSKDQSGSRFLQKQLEVVNTDLIQLVFVEVLPVVSDLVIDVYGNYVIQKIFDFGTDEQKIVMASKLLDYIIPLSLHLYGCRVVQKALETLLSYIQVYIIIKNTSADT